MPDRIRIKPTSHLRSLFVCGALALLAGLGVRAVDFSTLLTEAPTLDTLHELYNAGEYEQAVSYAERGQDIDPWVNAWELYKSESLIALGRYEEAYSSLEAYVSDRNYDLRARLMLREAALLTGRSEEASRQRDALGYLVNERSRRYGYDPENIVAVGRIALLFGVEPKIVLENFYRRAQDYGTSPLSSYLAAGELALSKHDYKLASQTFQKGLELHPANAELWHGLASSFKEGDRAKMIEYAERALTLNPRHAPTRILIATHLIAAESYEAAAEQLNLVLRTNPSDAEALALKAALSYIRNDQKRGDELRKQALEFWSDNPQVDHLIGQQLSRKYRFEEGFAFQSKALAFDPAYTPAMVQLSQDLLRLGRNDEAWPLAETAHEADPYNIAAYNLVTLRDRLQNFTTLESDRFLIRLSHEEAEVYGPRALRVLEDAHRRLSESYDIELPVKTTVEIYPNPADFETRTFGMPGNPGFLGVCFGPVFTINSPATRSSNWEAVLFHEFCHTITLTLSNNRMPRWLSEGISVYEEQEANPAWGQRMTAGYRDRILAGNMQPISNMSASFLRAEGGEDIQFAYFLSYLVVEYIVETYGKPVIRELLVELGEGTDPNEALSASLAPLDELDENFKAFAQDKAAQLASDFRFSSSDGPASLTFDFLQPKTNYNDEFQSAQELIAAEKWEESIEVLSALVDEAGYLPGAENAHWPLAKAYREIGDTNKERETLIAITEHEASHLPAVTRLTELAAEAEDAQAQFRWALAWIAISPMAETPWRRLLETSLSLSKLPTAAESTRSLLALETPDAPALHFQLAQLLQDEDPHLAKRHVLIALEEAPRYQKAFELLDTLQEATAPVPKPQALDPIDALELDYDFVQ